MTAALLVALNHLVNGVYPPITLNIEPALISPLTTELSAKLAAIILLAAVVVSFPDVTTWL